MINYSIAFSKGNICTKWLVRGLWSYNFFYWISLGGTDDGTHACLTKVARLYRYLPALCSIHFMLYCLTHGPCKGPIVGSEGNIPRVIVIVAFVSKIIKIKYYGAHNAYKLHILFAQFDGFVVAFFTITHRNIIDYHSRMYIISTRQPSILVTR